MKKCIIIGGGPAGLTAGYELLKNSDEYEVIILEASDVLGGISRTVKHNGNRMDIGGHRFFSKDKNVTDFWANLMPTQGAPSLDDKILGREKPLAKGGPDPETEDRVMLIRRRVSRIFYLNKFFDYPISMKPQTFINMGLPRTVKAGFSYLKSTVSKKEETSLENFYINRFGKVLYSMFFEGYTEKLWGRHPSEISADWGAQRVKGLSILAVIKDMLSKLVPGKNRKVETSLIEEFVYPKFGPGQLWEAVGDEFTGMGGKILYGHKVKDVEIADGRVVSVTCENGEKLSGDIFISSMPVKDLVAGMGSDVPDAPAEIAEGLPYRDFVTVGLLLNKLNLKNETDIKTLGNIVPDCWIYVQDTGVKLGRIQIFNNWSPYLVNDPENTVWVGLEYFCAEGDDFWNMSEQECVDFAVKELKSMGVIDADAKVLDSHREKVQKAYPAYFDTYDRIGELVEYLDTFENLYCVGRNGQHRYNNMDHSMVTSFEAVSNILSGKKTKENIWSVNTEAEYHEESSDENKN
ncbi:MAG: NAD(P)/FAD-dependent oxidoreductase [Ruminococcaceae bacterium]|nr:NAD(P)/FAD-dependent oxidoreductase [Oscillospiraceae bacterium]